MTVPSERRIVFLIGAVQFVNILDYMMVMPLGPDFGREIGIANSELGWVTASYSAAATIAGVIGAVVLDRFERRVALAILLLGLSLGTIAGGFASNLYTMLAARLFAGFFGGPATSVALSIIADVVPPERRGRAMGAVMGAFSVASVLGVPAGLELARLGGWQTPFFCVGGLALVVTSAAVFMLPPLPSPRSRAGAAVLARSFSVFSRDSGVRLALCAMGLAFLGNFALIPFLSAYFQFNAHYPRNGLGILYLIGGIVSFGTLRLAGRLVDRKGAPAAVVVGTVLLIAVLGLGFVTGAPIVPVAIVFVGFMFANSFRMVGLQALSSRVPFAAERGRFMSAQSIVQHIAASLGPILAGSFMSERADHGLDGIGPVAMASIALALIVPLVATAVQKHVRHREAALAAGPSGGP